MGSHSVDGGLATTRLSVADNDAADRTRKQAAARNVLSGIAADKFGARDGDKNAELAAAHAWAEVLDMLGLTPGGNGQLATMNRAAVPAPFAPAANPTGQPRVVASIRRPAAEDDFHNRGICRDEDPELFFAVGTSGPALLQIEQAKAVCRRCPVVDRCLQWALDGGVDDGVWGGMSEDERRAHKRRYGTRTTATAA